MDQWKMLYQGKKRGFVLHGIHAKKIKQKNIDQLTTKEILKLKDMHLTEVEPRAHIQVIKDRLMTYVMLMKCVTEVEIQC